VIVVHGSVGPRYPERTQKSLVDIRKTMKTSLNFEAWWKYTPSLKQKNPRLLWQKTVIWPF